MGHDDPNITRNQRHDRHRLGRIDGKVPSGMVLDFSIAAMPPQLLALDASGKQFGKDMGIDLALEA